MEELINLIVEKRNLSDSTIKNYKSVLRRLQVLVGKKDVEPFLKSNNLLLQKIKKGYKKPYQLNLINVMVVSLDAYTDHIKDSELENSLEKFREYQMQLKKELDKNKYNQCKTEKEHENWVSYDKLQETIKINFKATNKILKRANLGHKEARVVMNWVVSTLYAGSVKNPPPRLDFNNMIILTKDEYAEDHKENQNYLVIHTSRTKYFVFAEYKTAKTYGKKSVKLSPPLNRMINQYMKIREQLPQSQYLLFNNKGEPINESTMSVMIADAFQPTGKHITANLIRHIYITDYAKKQPLEMRKLISEQMGHNLEMALCYEKNN